MITLEKQPPLVDLSGSFLPLWVTSDNDFLDEGTFFTADIKWNALPPDNSDLDFTWFNGDYEVKIDFEAAPDDTGEEISNQGGGVFSWIQNTLIPGLENNYYLDKFFTFERVGADVLRITARNKGADYIITFATDDLPVVITPSGADDPQKKENFGIQVILEYSPITDTGNIIRHEKFLNAIDGKAYFDISDPLQYAHSRALPDFGQNGIKDVSAQVLRYRHRTFEAYGNSPVFHSRINTSSWKYLLPGGRSKNNIVDHPDWYAYWLNDGVSKFLTHTTSKKVGPDQPLFLSWYQRHSAINVDANISFRAKLFFDDDTNSTHTLGTAPAAQNHLFIMDGGYQKIKSHIPADKTLVKWELSVFETEVRSNVITATLDTRHYQDEIQLLYQNSLGADEIWRFTGDISNKTSFHQLVANRSIKHPEAKTDRTKQVIDSAFEDAMEINTGHLSKEEIDHFRDVLNSRDVYLMEGTWLPVIIEPADLQRGTTNSGRLNAHRFQIKLDRERFYNV